MRCLYCYQPLLEEYRDFHPSCSKKLFGQSEPPVLDYSISQMLELAREVIQNQWSVTGVQAKLSLGGEYKSKQVGYRKLTITGVLGRYILKPPSEFYPNLPELEDLTMHLAEIAGIVTVPHTLIRLQSGELSYLTKRIDRQKRQKIHMEDMCQITERLTEFKYRGSYEQIGKAIVRHAANPGLDLINFLEVLIFSFLTGNNDMHLKNFSLIKHPEKGYGLSPAYDLVSSELVVEGDDEEMALTLNGKKNRLSRHDFETFAYRFGIEERAFENLLFRFKGALPQWEECVAISFLPEQMKSKYIEMLNRKAGQLQF